MRLAATIYELTRQLPDYEKYGLRSQLNRAAVSVPSNIAEGCSRTSNRHFKVFLETAIGSLFEVETQLLIVKVTKLLPSEKLTGVLGEVVECQKLVRSYWDKVD